MKVTYVEWCDCDAFYFGDTLALEGCNLYFEDLLTVLEGKSILSFEHINKLTEWLDGKEVPESLKELEAAWEH